MEVLIYLIPIALVMGVIGLTAFLWSLKNNQFEDLDGAASRILFDDDDDNNYEDSKANKDDKNSENNKNSENR